MKRRLLFPILITTALLTSCNRNIRSELSNYIASFSLQESMSTYLESGFTITTVEIKDEIKTTWVDETKFNKKDADNLFYQHIFTTYDSEDNVVKLEMTTYQKNGDKYYKIDSDLDGTKSETEASSGTINSLIEKFFYEDAQLDGIVHLKGLYYGDYIKQIIPNYQNLYTVNEDGLLQFEASQKDVNKYGNDYTIHQKYEVNKIGMLERNYLERSTENLTVYKTIDVYKV